MTQFVFGYGSLMNPESLARTAPEVDQDSCIPATAKGFVRAWSVAFPNDGSQGDKSYFDECGERPPFVLFVTIRAQDEVADPDRCQGANGILIPVEPDRLRRMSERERRYRLVNVTFAVVPYPSFADRLGQPFEALTFVAQDRYSQPEDVAQGIVSRTYKETIEAGARFWNDEVAGFADDYRDCTIEDANLAVHPLRRVDHLS